MRGTYLTTLYLFKTGEQSQVMGGLPVLLIDQNVLTLPTYLIYDRYPEIDIDSSPQQQTLPTEYHRVKIPTIMLSAAPYLE